MQPIRFQPLITDSLSEKPHMPAKDKPTRINPAVHTSSSHGQSDRFIPDGVMEDLEAMADGGMGVGLEAGPD